MSSWGYYPDYVSVAERRAQAVKEIAKLRKKGSDVRPIEIEGRKIAKSFWGKAWCDNLERYSDYENRLPRGRSYVTHGAVIDLKIARGKVEALVNGSSLYKVKIDIAVAAPPRWKAICADCAGSVGSLVELLQGKLSKNVMERVCRGDDGLFPASREIKMSCSCPDGASMCKHVAAALYGVGARLDSEPDLLFLLRGVDRAELVSHVADLPLTRTAASSANVLADDDVAALFGLDMETSVVAVAKAPSAAKPADSDKAKAAKTKRLTSISPPPAPTPVRKPGKRGAVTPTPALAAVTAPKRRAPLATAPAPSKAPAPPAAKTRRSETKPAGRTRVAKWIGARKAKAGR